MNKIKWLLSFCLLFPSLSTYAMHFLGRYEMSYSTGDDGGVVDLGTIAREVGLANRISKFRIVLRGREMDSSMYQEECVDVGENVVVCSGASDGAMKDPGYENIFGTESDRLEQAMGVDPLDLYHPLDFIQKIKNRELGGMYTINLGSIPEGVKVTLDTTTSPPGRYEASIGKQRLTRDDYEQLFRNNEGGGRILKGNDDGGVDSRAASGMDDVEKSITGARGMLGVALPAFAQMYMRSDNSLEYYGFMTTNDEEHMTKERVLVLPIPHVTGVVNKNNGMIVRMSLIHVEEILPITYESATAVLKLKGGVVVDPRAEGISKSSRYHDSVKVIFRFDKETNEIFNIKIHFHPRVMDQFTRGAARRGTGSKKSLSRVGIDSQYIEFSAEVKKQTKASVRVTPHQQEREGVRERAGRYFRGCLGCFNSGSD